MNKWLSLSVRLLFATTIVFLFQSGLRAQSIWSNPITGTNPSAENPYTTGQTIDPNITVEGLFRGPGLIANSGADRFNARDWTLSGTLDPNDYFDFTLAPNAGFQINFVSFVFTAQRNGNGPRDFSFRSSLDNFATEIAAPSATGGTIDLSAFTNIQDAISFRLYGFNSLSVAGTFSIDDFTFNGSVVPEPATVLLICAGAAGLVRTVRRRRKTEVEQPLAV